MTHTIHNGEWFKNLLWCDIPRNKAPHRGPRHIWCTYTLFPFIGREKNTDGSAVGLMILLDTVCYGDFCWGLLLLLLLFLFFFLKIFFNITSLSTWFRVGVSNQNCTDGFLLKFILFPAIARYPQLSASFRVLCMTGHSCRNIIPVRYDRLLQWQQNRSKATMWLLYKISAIQGCPRHCY